LKVGKKDFRGVEQTFYFGKFIKEYLVLSLKFSISYGLGNTAIPLKDSDYL
jgi:hypothetical protein